MNRYSLNTLILLGVISIAGIMIIQGVWVRKTMELQVKNIAIQEKEDSLNLKEFSEQSHVALRNVLEKINTNLSDSSDVSLFFIKSPSLHSHVISIDLSRNLKHCSNHN